MSAVRAVNIAADVYGILICLILILYLHVSEARTRALRHYFSMMCVCGIAIQLGDISNWAFEGTNSAWYPFLLKGGTLLFFIGSALLLLFYTRYMIEYLSTRVKVNPAFWRLSLTLGSIYMLLCIISMYNGMFFVFLEGNIYQRGGCFWISQLIPFILYTISVSIVIVYCRYLAKKELVSFLIYIIFPITAEIIQIYNYGVSLLTPAIMLSLLFIFVNIQLEGEIALKEREKELAESKIAVMNTQIQSHFLYNILALIRQLCDSNPALAKDAITEFSYFLRANMSALNDISEGRGTVSFTQEVKHVKNYLKLEEMRFGDRLKVVYEIGASDFKLPLLSIQPLVENAVCHGILKKEEGGTVTIRSEENEDNFMVIIQDDGIGLTLAPHDTEDRIHIGINNVKNRVAAMCGGSVEIRESPGKGTIAVIRIPKNPKRGKDCAVSGDR